MNKKKAKICSLAILFIIIFSNFYITFINQFEIQTELDDNDKNIYSSGEISHSEQWLKNNEFLTQDYWFNLKGNQGDNSTVDANISNNQANYIIAGKNDTFNILSGNVNSSTWYGWGIYNNSDYLLPDHTEINATGCYVYHYLDEGESGGAGQVHNFPSVHFKKNVTIPVDMSDYEITSALLEVFFNASVAANVDAPGDSVGQSAIWDSATFYVEISDLDNSYAFRVAENKTQTLGQDSPPILTIPDRELSYVSENDLITALNLALEKDVGHSRFTIIMGLDIYCEDNDFPDYDLWNALIFNSFNLTFTYEKKIDQFSSISWNQIGNTISGGNIQITDARLSFMYKMDQLWATADSPFSEIRVVINDNQHTETIRLSSANETFQEAKLGGFDVTYLILKDVNISVSIQVFIANTFALNRNITISIDDVYLNISYAETVPDIQTKLDLFLEGDNKTSDPFIQIQSNELLNITINYDEKQSGAHISNATVQLQGKISDFLNDTGSQQYSILVNTSQLGIGVKTLSISAQKDNYETQILQFFVEVTEISSEMLLYVNSTLTDDSETINVEVNQFLNITVYYIDNNTKQHLSGATVSISGFGELNETSDHYNMTISTNDLEQGITVLTINALIEDYSPQTIQFYVEVSERATDIQLFIEDYEITSNPTYEITIGEMLNITIKYLDNITGFHISGAIVQVNAGTFSENLTEYVALTHYSALFNTSSLQIGVNLINIIAYKNNYQIKTILLRLTVRKISGIIITTSGKTFFETEPGGRILLSITLNNTDFGGIIKNATVTYRWAYGQGELMDPDNDGVYEAYISDIPEGIYTITISAYAGDNYVFQSFDITISAIPPVGEDLSWLVYSLIGGIAGLSLFFILYQTHFKYPPMVRKIRKLKKKIRKERKLKTIPLNNRKEIMKSNYKDQIKILDFEQEQFKKVEDFKNLEKIKEE